MLQLLPLNCPYRLAEDRGLLSSCLFTYRPFPWRGSAATFLRAPTAPRLSDPSACHRGSTELMFDKKRCQGCSALR